MFGLLSPGLTFGATPCGLARLLRSLGTDVAVTGHSILWFRVQRVGQFSVQGSAAGENRSGATCSSFGVRLLFCSVLRVNLSCAEPLLSAGSACCLVFWLALAPHQLGRAVNDALPEADPLTVCAGDISRAARQLQPTKALQLSTPSLHTSVNRI